MLSNASVGIWLESSISAIIVSQSSSIGSVREFLTVAIDCYFISIYPFW